jgi:hypothetical protein
MADLSGVKCTVSWKESIYLKDWNKWLPRFTNELAVGKTVAQAVDYANGFNDYKGKTSNNHHDITNIKYTGDENQPIKVSNAEVMNTEANLSNKGDITDRNVFIYTKEDNNINGVSFNIPYYTISLDETDDDLGTIAKILDEYCAIKVNDNYQKFVYNIDEDYSIVKYTRMVSGYKSNSEIVVNVHDGKITSVFSNIIESQRKIQIQNVMLDEQRFSEFTMQKKSMSKEISVVDSVENVYYDFNKERFIYSIGTIKETLIDGETILEKDVIQYDVPSEYLE